MRTAIGTEGLASAEVSALLAGVADRAGDWLRARRSPLGPGFGLCAGAFEPVELNATTSGVELWVMLGLPLGRSERTDWARHLAGYQRESTGLVVDPTWSGREVAPDPRRLRDGDDFFTMTTAAALEALGARLPFPVAALVGEHVQALAGRIDWRWIAHNRDGVGDLGPLVRHNAALGVDGAAEQWAWLQGMLVQRQDPSGFWLEHEGAAVDALGPQINRAFHVLRASWNLAGRPVERADLLTDACITAAEDESFYGWDAGFACNDLDLAHVAYSAAAWSPHRREELAASARRILGRLLRVEQPGGGFGFFHETAMEEHGGLRMSPGRRESDTWGTLMYLGAIRMTAELGWPGIAAPWGFSRVHAVPTRGAR